MKKTTGVDKGTKAAETEQKEREHRQKMEEEEMRRKREVKRKAWKANQKAREIEQKESEIEQKATERDHENVLMYVLQLIDHRSDSFRAGPYRRRRSRASPVLTAISLVNGKPWETVNFDPPHKIDIL